MSARMPRGLRNHNPGNLRHGDDWQGLCETQTDPAFCQFTSPEWGIRALAKVLLSYHRKRGLRTVRGIINRWAPPVENDTAAYIASVARALGVKPDATIDVEHPGTLTALVKAIIRHENGMQPYPGDIIAEGVRRALHG